MEKKKDEVKKRADRWTIMAIERILKRTKTESESEKKYKGPGIGKYLPAIPIISNNPDNNNNIKKQKVKPNVKAISRMIKRQLNNNDFQERREREKEKDRRKDKEKESEKKKKKKKFLKKDYIVKLEPRIKDNRKRKREEEEENKNKPKKKKRRLNRKELMKKKEIEEKNEIQRKKIAEKKKRTSKWDLEKAGKNYDEHLKLKKKFFQQ